MAIKNLGYGPKSTGDIFQYIFHIYFIILDFILRINTTLINHN